MSTKSINFATAGTQRKTIMQCSVPTPTPNKAAILVAVTKLIDTSDVFDIQSLSTKKQINSAIGGTAK